MDVVPGVWVGDEGDSLYVVSFWVESAVYEVVLLCGEGESLYSDEELFVGGCGVNDGDVQADGVDVI